MVLDAVSLVGGAKNVRRQSGRSLSFSHAQNGIRPARRMPFFWSVALLRKPCASSGCQINSIQARPSNPGLSLDPFFFARFGEDQVVPMIRYVTAQDSALRRKLTGSRVRLSGP